MTAKYLPIWEALKKDKIVVLAVPIPLHKKLIKEVIRVKDLDVLFKFEASEARKSYRIDSTNVGARITIRLNEYPELEGLNPNEL